jgi:hypothetical protein
LRRTGWPRRTQRTDAACVGTIGAQRDIDLRPELYTRYYKNEFPDRFHAAMDTRRWGPGERIVFESYSREVYEQSFEWIEKHGIFKAGKMGDGDYDKPTVAFGTI